MFIDGYLLPLASHTFDRGNLKLHTDRVSLNIALFFSNRLKAKYM